MQNANCKPEQFSSENCSALENPLAFPKLQNELKILKKIFQYPISNIQHPHRSSNKFQENLYKNKNYPRLFVI